jgi:ribulose-5-phosphate 4-epimerase/fuculose-1-phosphate aldolase
MSQTAGNVTPLQSDYLEERRDLAAAFRWIARLGMHEGIANHFSLAVSDDGAQFLLNPFGRHFSQMRASDLLLLDARAGEPEGLNDTVDGTAWYIHGALHRNVPQARCVMHLHSKYATVLATLKDPALPPIDQTACRFYNRVAIDTGFGGLGLAEEGERLSTLMGNHSVLLMGNHGILTAAPTVARAFDLIYYFERACETYITALSTGREIAQLPDDVADKTAREIEEYEMPQYADRHLAAVRSILDEDEPAYRD